jgi:dipeptidase
MDLDKHSSRKSPAEPRGPQGKKLARSTLAVFWLIILALGAGLIEAPAAQEVTPPLGCTVIGVGRLAMVDGSVITSQTDCCSECRIQVIPARTHPPGSKAAVHWGMTYFGRGDDRRALPLGDFGKVIGEIPQVEKTFGYLHTGYSHINERQLAIGESTCSQRPELAVPFVEGKTRQIMTVEQAQVFALERCTKAREAVKLIGSLVEKYGFLPSCGGPEALCLADPAELWEMEICSVGPDWTPESGKPGAIWVARRVPDDQVVVVPNHFRQREIDPANPDQMASPNYMQEAIDRGWYDPKSGRPFIWQDAYAEAGNYEGSLSRLWLIYSTIAPSLKAWPKRTLDSAAGPRTLYGQTIEGSDFYPFSVKPERKLSVRDIIAFQRSSFEDTIYDMTLDPAWSVAGPEGKVEKSPMASAFFGAEMERVLRIRHHRTIAGPGYGMVAQLRSWLPDAIGGIYWFYVDNPSISAYVPVYVGVKDVSPLYKTYDYNEFSEDSARWAVDFIEKLMLLRWQDAVKDLREARDPVEKGFFEGQAEVEAKAQEMLKKNPAAAAKYLTDLTISRMEKVVNVFRELRKTLLTKYGGDVV